MQFSQIFTIAAIAGSAIATPAHLEAYNAGAIAGSAIATPAHLEASNAGLQKRACWELKGKPLEICQKACEITCIASAGLAGQLCAASCGLSNLKREVAVTTAQAGAVNNAVKVTSLDVANNEISLKVDASVGRTACVIACEIACNSTVLALMQEKCLLKCKALCPGAPAA